MGATLDQQRSALEGESHAGGQLRSPSCILAVLLMAVGLLACGSGGGTSSGDSQAAEGEPEIGGTLNLLGVGDVDHMDPNVSYYSIGYLAHRAWSRQPYSYPADPESSTTAVPDMATALPEVGSDGKTATWVIREGVQWDTDPPRQVTAEDAIRGIKINCNPAQPFGGIPDYLDLIAGLSEFCGGFVRSRPIRTPSPST